MTTETKKPDPVPGVPADLKGRTWTELHGIFETFAKEKPDATNDEHIAVGLMFLCALRDGDEARRRDWEHSIEERITAYEKFGVDELRRIEGKSLAVLAADKLREMWARTEAGQRGEPFFQPGAYEALMKVAGELSAPVGAYAHVAHRDSLERYGTGHPVELPCAACRRPSWDKAAAITVDGKTYCSAACAEVIDTTKPGELT
jgi:hypothetical protein